MASAVLEPSSAAVAVTLPAVMRIVRALIRSSVDARRKDCQLCGAASDPLPQARRARAAALAERHARGVDLRLRAVVGVLARPAALGLAARRAGDARDGFAIVGAPPPALRAHVLTAASRRRPRCP